MQRQTPALPAQPWALLPGKLSVLLTTACSPSSSAALAHSSAHLPLQQGLLVTLCTLTTRLAEVCSESCNGF